MEPLKRQPYEDSAEFFKEKLVHYDNIEGYRANNPERSLYQRDIVTAHIVDAAGNETGETLKAYMYHRFAEKIKEDEPVPNGDWLQRKRN